MFVGLFVLFVAVGKTGAIAALGDTLYPSMSLVEGLKADLSQTGSLLRRLRLLHPALGVAVGLVLIYAVGSVPIDPRQRAGQIARRLVVVLTATQVALGFANIWLLAPVWMQLLHLGVADLLWIALVVTAAAALAKPDRAEA
jgi:heme A synthase